MTSKAPASSYASIPFPRLPWILGAVFLLLFLITLNPGPGLLTIATTAKVTGWDWTPLLQYPLYYVVTLPVRLLPDGLEMIGLNVLSAIMGGLTIGLLARSVQLLPQDRTRDQRERERNERGLLTGPLAWLPVVAAVIVGGLQLVFWQNATNASVEMLDLLVLALIIRELLEYRLDQKDSRMVRVAFLYGLGVTNNFALIALFPFTLGAVIWILGVRFFRSTLILKLFMAGLAGLTLYLLLPLLATRSDVVEVSFWEALKTNLVAQKSMLGLGWSRRLFVMLMCLGSLFPLILIGVRWPSNLGDTSAAGNFLTRIMFQVLILIFIAAAAVMNLQLAYTERAQLEAGTPFSSLFYLSAIVVGYSIGYLLVLFGKEPERKWQKSRGTMALLNKGMVALAFLIPAAMLVLLLRDNLPKIGDYNKSLLAEYTREMAAQLPETGSLVVSDDVVLLWSVRHHLERNGSIANHWLLHSQSLNFPGYHRQLRRELGDNWPELPEDVVFDDNIEDSYIALLVFNKSRERPLRYLHSSFGYFFERMYTREDGLLYALEPYPASQLEPPLPDDALVESQSRFLQGKWDSDLEPLAQQLRRGLASWPDQYLANVESRQMNNWGVRLQMNHLPTQATPWFERAAQLNTNNASALINLEYNRFLQSEQTNEFQISERTASVLGNYRQNILAVLNTGGVIDTPGYRLMLGQQLAMGKNYRQAALQYLRAAELTPEQQRARAELARTFLQAQSPDRALEMIQEIRKATAGKDLNRYAEMDLLSMEAGALFSKGRREEALQVIDTGLNRYPDDIAMRDVAAQVLLSFAPYWSNAVAKAEPLIARQILSSPTNNMYRFNSGSLAMIKHDWAAAIDSFTTILNQTTNFVGARLNRAISLLQADQLEEAKADYATLLESTPHDFRLHFGLGTIADKQDRREDAIEHFEAYLRTAPRNNPEYTNIASRVAELQSQ